MNKHAIVFSLLMIVPIAGILAQSTQESLPLKARAERGLQHSDLQVFLDASAKGPSEADGVGSAIIAAGKSNDPFWVPYLRPFLKYARDRNPNLSDLAGAAQLALAKLGEKEQLQEIGCEANFGSSSIQDNAIRRKLKSVQGWFSVSVLARLMDEDTKQAQILRDRPGDEIFADPQDLALIVLPEIIRDPPLAAPPPIFVSMRNQEKLAPLRQAWREWITKNEESLRKLTPLGDGLDLSRPACKRVLAQDRHYDRSTLE